MATTTGTLLTYCEQKTQAGAGTLNSANGISFLNEAMVDFRAELIKRGVDAAQTQESYIPSVTPPSSGSGSTFAYPSDMFILKTITVNMTDTTNTNYLQAQQVDVANTPDQQSFEFMRQNQPITSPQFDDRGDTFEIFPSFTSSMNLTNAVRIFYFLQPVTYSTTGDALNYPDTLDWYAIADRVNAFYYESLNKFTEAEYWRGSSNRRIERLVESLAPGSEQPIQATPIQLTGWEF